MVGGGTNALALSFLETEIPRKAIAGKEKGLRANVTPRGGVHASAVTVLQHGL